MKYIPNDLINEAKEKVNLLAYIESATGTSAKRVGNAYFINPCPICGGKDHFSIEKKKNYFNSFSCDAGGTIIDFMMQYENFTKQEALQKVIEISGLKDYTKEIDAMQQNQNKKATTKLVKNYSFNAIIERMHSNVNQTDYFLNRGLSQQIIDKYKLGYASNGMNDAIEQSSLLNESPNDYMKSYKYFLPIWDEDDVCRYFITRLDENSVSEGLEKPHKTHNLKGYKAKLFNERYLKSCESDVIFIVEGIFDALSIEDMGYSAIALNSVVNAGILAKKIKEYKEFSESKEFVLIPDNDAPGESLSSKLQTKLKDVGRDLHIYSLPSEFKDVNEFFINKPQELREFLADIQKSVDWKWREQFVSSYLGNFFSEITAGGITPIPTGFKELDNKLNGGLIPGLYVLGAISSLGKTAFVHQICDYIAMQNTPVFYFSLEMSRKELISRSLSRQTFSSSSQDAYSSQEFLQSKVPQQLLSQTINAYYGVAENLSIMESAFNSDVINIRNSVKDFKRKCNNFVVVVDYLQIMQMPHGKSLSDKQLADYNVTQLKKMSRDFDVPVVVISSFNRANYGLPVSYESFKESGGIEYSADVVMGLQFKGIEKAKREQINKWREKEKRELELVILKQRNGVAFAKMDFNYQAKFNFFEEMGA